MDNLKPVFFLCLIAMAAPSFAMNMQMPQAPDNNSTVFYRFQKPFYSGEANNSFLTGVHDLGIILASTKGALILNFPFTVADYQGGLYNQDTFALGNIFVGYRSLNPGPKPNFRAGINLPSFRGSGSLILLTGLYSDPLNLQKFARDRLTVQLGMVMDSTRSNGLSTHVDIGPDFYIPTGKSNQDMEVSLRYGAGLGFRQKSLELTLELAGLWMMTEDGGFSETTLHTLSIGAEFNAGKVSPGVFISKPLDENLDLVDWLVGFQIRVHGVLRSLDSGSSNLY